MPGWRKTLKNTPLPFWCRNQLKMTAKDALIINPNISCVPSNPMVKALTNPRMIEGIAPMIPAAVIHGIDANGMISIPLSQIDLISLFRQLVIMLFERSKVQKSATIFLIYFKQVPSA